MSRKHSFFYLSFSSVYFLHCVLYCRNLPNIQIYPVKTEATGSSCHPRHLVHGIESPPDIFIALPLSRSSHDPSGLNCSSDSQVQDEGRKAKKSQCEAGALDISVLSAGPEVRNRTVLHGSASSFSVGGVDGWRGRSGSNGSYFIGQIILSVCLLKSLETHCHFLVR